MTFEQTERIKQLWITARNRFENEADTAYICQWLTEEEQKEYLDLKQLERAELNFQKRIQPIGSN